MSYAIFNNVPGEFFGFAYVDDSDPLLPGEFFRIPDGPELGDGDFVIAEDGVSIRPITPTEIADNAADAAQQQVLDDAVNTAALQALINVDPVGTDNSTNVTLAAGSDPALTLTGQELDLTLPALGGTDLSVQYSLVNVLLESSSGADVLIESAQPFTAGLMSSAEHLKLAGLVYGTEYFFANDDAVISNDTTGFQPALSLGAVVEGGNYMLTVAYGWNHDLATNDFEAQILLGGAPFKEIHKQEPKDAAGTFGTTGTSQRNYMTRKMPVTLPAGAVLFELEYRTDSAGDNSSVWERTLELLRVS